jgi:hypothetical protein
LVVALFQEGIFVNAAEIRLPGLKFVSVSPVCPGDEKKYLLSPRTLVEFVSSTFLRKGEVLAFVWRIHNLKDLKDQTLPKITFYLHGWGTPILPLHKPQGPEGPNP